MLVNVFVGKFLRELFRLKNADLQFTFRGNRKILKPDY